MLSWKVGNVTITSVVESETPTSPRFLFPQLSKADVAAIADECDWLRPHFVDGQGYLLQKIQALVIETGDTTIVVDTCVGNDKVRANPGWHQLAGAFLADLAQAGCGPDEVDVVICTHLHVDHVGWNTKLVDGRWEPTFPNARYLFERTEFEYWRDNPDGGDDVFGDSVRPVHDAGLATLVDPDHVITPEVRLESTPGHTPGHVSVIIESNGERAVITGDMMHTPLQMARVELSSSFDTDPDRARVTRRAFLQRWADGSTLVIGTHFGTPTAGLVRPDGEDRWRLEV
jgi:glyoxylase-like metal-dependent hydrolase (beta-lactamase superfamily II)